MPYELSIRYGAWRVYLSIFVHHAKKQIVNKATASVILAPALCNDVAENERGLSRFHHSLRGGSSAPRQLWLISLWLYRGAARSSLLKTFFVTCVSLLWKIRGHIAVLPYLCLVDGVLIQGDSANLYGALARDRSGTARRRDTIHAFIQLDKRPQVFHIKRSASFSFFHQLHRHWSISQPTFTSTTLQSTTPSLYRELAQWLSASCMD